MRDFLDEVIAESTKRNPEFPKLMKEAAVRRANARRLAAAREKKGLSQGAVAERMKTTQSVVSKLEGGADVKLSTLMRYCAAIGLAWKFDPRAA